MKTLKTKAIVIFAACLIMSCGENAEKLKSEIKNTQNTIENASKAVNEADDMADNMNLLKSKTPLSKEKFESWSPKTLLGLPLTSSTINMLPGMGSCGNTYSIKNKRIRVMIIDGAGEKGSGAVQSYQMSSKMEYNQDESWGTTKTKTINGLKVKETKFKGDDKYNLSLFYNNRFAVDIETSEVNSDELEQIFIELKLDQLQ
jgi:hypothetical protein